MNRLNEAQVKENLSRLTDWEMDSDRAISRLFAFKNFNRALLFVNAVGFIAEQHNHHPDIDIRFNQVRLVLSTHDSGGLTQKDFNLAREIENLPKLGEVKA